MPRRDNKPRRLVVDGDVYLWSLGHTHRAARALLDEALACGWRPDDPLIHEVDGWTVFEAVAARRRE
jgi:hypothetical protein